MEPQENTQMENMQPVEASSKKNPWIALVVIAILIIIALVFIKGGGADQDLLDIESDLLQTELDELSLDSELDAIEFSDIGSNDSELDAVESPDVEEVVEVDLTTIDVVEQELADTEELEASLDSELDELEALDF
jgi:hypothetical protein